MLPDSDSICMGGDFKQPSICPWVASRAATVLHAASSGECSAGCAVYAPRTNLLARRRRGRGLAGPEIGRGINALPAPWSAGPPGPWSLEPGGRAPARCDNGGMCGETMEVDAARQARAAFGGGFNRSTLERVSLEDPCRRWREEERPNLMVKSTLQI